ncbi:MAG: hypothetical protein ACRD1N_11920, partial [Terriglobia bacterium]
SGASEITVMDRLSKQPVVVTFTPNSLLHELPPATAQQIATRLRPKPAGNEEHEASHAPPAEAAASKPERFSRLVRSLPAINIADLKKGDVVMVVATEGGPSGPLTAVNLVSGAGPILTAAPAGKNNAALQSLWSGFSTSAGGSGGEAGEGNQGGGGGAASGSR